MEMPNTSAGAASLKSRSPWFSMQSWKNGIRKMTRRRRGRSLLLDTATSPASTTNPQHENESSIILPTVVWMTHIFPLLDRPSQNNLAQICRQVAVTRRQHYTNNSSATTMAWPRGRIRPSLARPVKTVVFSPDNKHLWVTCCRSKIVMYDKLTGLHHEHNRLKAHPGATVADVHFSPMDPTVFATAGKSDGMLRLWKLSQPCNNSEIKTDTQGADGVAFKCFRVLKVYQHGLWHLKWAPTGDKIATWGDDGFVRVSNVVTGRLQSRLWKTRLEVQGCHRTVVFDPTGTSVAFAVNNEEVHIWNLVTNRVRMLPMRLNSSYAGTHITSLAYQPKGDVLVVGSHVATLHLWRLVPNTTTIDAPVESQETDNDSSVARSDNDNNPRRLEISDYHYTYMSSFSLGGGWSAVTLITFTADGRYLACSNHGSQIRIVNFASQQVLKTLVGHSGRIESLAFTADSQTLASGACDRTVRLWDMTSLLA